MARKVIFDKKKSSIEATEGIVLIKDAMCPPKDRASDMGHMTCQVVYGIEIHIE